MPVGKGSLTRAAKATEGAKAQVAAPAKKASVKKTVPKKEAPQNIVAAASVISGSDDIHEKKFEAISKIKCDLPTYLL